MSISTTTQKLAVSDVRPFIGSRDFNASRDFYVALGWRVTYDADDLRLLELGNHRFYLQRYYNKQWCNNTMLHVTVESVDDWFAFVQDVFTKHQFAGDARHSGGIKDEGYARVLHVWDPSGALLHFAEFTQHDG